MFQRIVENFVGFKRIPTKVVIFTALASYILQMGMIIEGQPLYIIVAYGLLPWVPVLLFEWLWKVKHYHWIAILGAITVLQLGHLGEHIAQVTQLSFMDGTAACPPPVDNAANAGRAVEAGLRPAGIGPTDLSTSFVIMPNAQGLPSVNANSVPISGPAACGIFGQLDIELIHLTWEMFGWLATLWLLIKFPRNIPLWIAVIFLSVHTFEHLFISYHFFFNPEAVFAGQRQLWATTIEGNIVTAHPVGKIDALVNFYEAAGKHGVFGKNGLFGSLFPALNAILPARPFLHFGYNFFITIPTLVAFFLEVRHVYDHYLAKALPTLPKEQLIRITPQLKRERYKKGSIIVEQGDVPDRLYIISRGTVQVLQQDEAGNETLVNRLSSGQYFGEIELLQPSHRIASVQAETNVEVLAIDRKTFFELLEGSERSRRKLQQGMTERLEAAPVAE